MRGAVATVEVARLVRAPVDDVWRVFTDLPARARVMSTVDQVEPLTAVGFEVGTRWRETRTLHDDPVTEELRVESADPPYGCVVLAHGEEGDYRTEYRFESRDSGTRMWVRFSAELPERLGSRVLAIFFGGMVTRVIEGSLRRDLDDLADAIHTAAA